MDMRLIPLVDLVKQGYFYPETTLVHGPWCGLGKDDPLQEVLLIEELLLSRN